MTKKKDHLSIEIGVLISGPLTPQTETLPLKQTIELPSQLPWLELQQQICNFALYCLNPVTSIIGR